MGMSITKKNIREYAQKYDRDYKEENKRTEEKIKSLLKRQRYLTRENLKTIGGWKAPRARKHYSNRKNSVQRVMKVSKFSFSTKDEKARIESLDSLSGVGYPMSSTILHFAFPNKYPIMDFRVIRSLGWKKPSTYNFNFWEKYCEKIRSISNRCCLHIRIVEKALWKYDEEKHHRSRKRKCKG